MKAIIDGVIRDLTSEEENNIKELCEKENLQISDKDRLSALENAFAEFVLSLTGGDIQ